MGICTIELNRPRMCRLSPQELLLNHGFFDPENANLRATLLFDDSGGGGGAAPAAAGMEMVGWWDFRS